MLVCVYTSFLRREELQDTEELVCSHAQKTRSLQPNLTWCSLRTNVQVSSNHLRGLIPDVLVKNYSFWRTGPHTLYGYPRVDDNSSVIVVSMQQAENGTDWQAVIRRLEARYEAADTGGEHVSTARRPMTLLNLLEAHRPSAHQRTGDVGLLRRLSQLWATLDDLGHVLVWSASLGQVRNRQTVFMF